MRTVKSLGSILSFRPIRLAEARGRVARLHPARRSRPRTLRPEAVAALRVRVGEASAAPDPGKALIALAHDLFEHELLATVRSIGDWTDLRDAVTTIARERPLARYVPVLWRSWQAFPALEPVVVLLGEMAGRFGPDQAVAAPYADDALGWVRDEHPVDAVVRWTGRRSIASDELPEIPESPFEAETPLIKRIFHRTLEIGSREQLLGMEEETILGGWAEMSGKRHMRASANFLEQIPPDLWSERQGALESVRGSYGMPPGPRGAAVSRPAAPASIPTFWKCVSGERREDFRQHFIALELEIAFGGDATPDRREFWLAQRRGIVSVCHGTAGSTRWSLIDFPGFSVVEFFEVANAAYLYPANHGILRRIRSSTGLAGETSSPSELKLRSHGFGPPGDNRIIHGPGWQSSARWTLEAWEAHYP